MAGKYIIPGVRRCRVDRCAAPQLTNLANGPTFEVVDDDEDEEEDGDYQEEEEEEDLQTSLVDQIVRWRESHPDLKIDSPILQKHLNREKPLSGSSSSFSSSSEIESPGVESPDAAASPCFVWSRQHQQDNQNEPPSFDISTVSNPQDIDPEESFYDTD